MAIEDEPVAAQYESWVYPKPMMDLAEEVGRHNYFDESDPAYLRRTFWPKKMEPDTLDILIAGCGANQAVYYAYTNPEARVSGSISRAHRWRTSSTLKRSTTSVISNSTA